MPDDSDIRRVALLGTQVSACRFITAVEHLHQLVDNNNGAYVSCANAYSLSLAMSDTALQNILNASDMTTADGVPVVWALKLLGYSTAQRVHNDDLVLACCERYPGWKHFLVGGARGQSSKVVNALRHRFPGIHIVGHEETPERPLPAEESERILESITRSGANVVWVGMGTPAQDIWMSQISKRLDIPLVGCGSLFNLLAGHTRPAPEWMKRNGLQWLHRLLQEPQRLLFRYTYHNARFVLGFTRQYLRHQLQKFS